MVKKIINIVLIFILIMLTTCTLTGCGSNELKSNKDVENYLKEYYPNENFEILGRESISLEAQTSSGTVSKGKGYSYKINAKDTDIEFEVKDVYAYRASGWSTYGVADNYLEKSIKHYVKQYGDNRLILEDNFEISTIEIKLNVSEFSSFDEMAELIYEFKEYMYSKKPFSYSESNKRKVYYYIYGENGEYLKHCSLNQINSIEDVEKNLK